MINISNHPFAKWSDGQKSAAFAIDGRSVVDLPFPNVQPTASQADVTRMARDCVTVAIASGETVAMVQGEFSLTFELTRMLLAMGIAVFVATSERKVVENADGSKTVCFDFVQFRQIR